MLVGLETTFKLVSVCVVCVLYFWTFIHTITTGPVLRLYPPSLSDCIFDDLKKEEANTNNVKIELDNYLDGIPDIEVGTKEAMAARIKEKLGNCGVYLPIGNNCEHIATYVRYNQKISLQVCSRLFWVAVM